MSYGKSLSFNNHFLKNQSTFSAGPNYAIGIVAKSRSVRQMVARPFRNTVAKLLNVKNSF